jgi:hypothetical protein
VPSNAVDIDNTLSVRAACHARITFGVAAPEMAILVIRYLNDEGLLARECRPVAVGADTIDIKTHPDATGISCSLQVAGEPIEETRFHVECGDDITPVGRHFIIIGAMKAGTTTLFNMLAQHSAICRTWVEVPDVGTSKEINYFRNEYRKGDAPVRYDWRFPFEASRHAWTLDASTNYTKLPGSRPVPARIATLGAETKLVYILREPVDRIESQMAHLMRDVAEVRSPQHCVRLSCYAQHLDKFAAHFSGDDILLLDFEQLRQDPGAIIDQVCDFLGIERFVTRAEVHNKRSVRFKLTAAQRDEFAQAVRPDVQRLIDVYGFEPASKWLQEPKRSRLKLPPFRE